MQEYHPASALGFGQGDTLDDVSNVLVKNVQWSEPGGISTEKDRTCCRVGEKSDYESTPVTNDNAKVKE